MITEKLKANETPPTHNNRSRGFGGVRYHCGLLETSTSKGGRGQNREEEEKYATIGNLDCHQKCYQRNPGLSYDVWDWRQLVTKPTHSTT